MDSTEKLANMTLGSRRQAVGQQPRPPPMKAGVQCPPMKAGVQWNSGSSDMFLRHAQDIQPGRTYSRKVMG